MEPGKPQALLEAEFRALEGLFGVRCAGAVRVKTCPTLREFRRAQGGGAATRGTRGRYDPQRREICIVLVRDGDYGPENVLLHEGVHAWLHGAVGPVPWWLSEGLATCFEFAETRGGSIELRTTNAGRLRDLQRLIRAGQCPSVRDTLLRTTASRYPSRDYAVAWGIVHGLLEHDRDALHRIVTEPGEEDPVAVFRRHVLADGQTLEQWETAWRKEMLTPR